MTGALLLTALAALPVRYAPAQPTVGDVVTIEVPRHAASISEVSGGEVLPAVAGRMQVRMMRPGSQRVSFTVSGSPQRYAFELAVVSVLTPDDKLQPAPLEAPRPLLFPRAATVALVAAVAAMFLSWGALAYFARRRKEEQIDAPPVPLLPARDEFLSELRSLAGRTDRAAAAILADATRRYLARTDATLTLEMTTSELLRRIDRERELVAGILRTGDLAKFAPWPVAADPRLIADAARLVDAYEPVEEAS